MKKIILPAVAALAIASSANAAIISVNFDGRSAGTLASGDVAGVESANNWNNVSSGDNSGSNATTSSLINDSGVVTSTSITYEQNFWSINNGTSTDGKVSSGYTNTSSTADGVLSIAGLGSEFTSGGYNVILYLGGTDSQGQNTAIEVGANIGGGTSQWIRHVRSTDATFSGYNSETFADEATAQSGSTNSNYVVFSGLTAASFDINVLKDSSSTSGWARAGIKGVQIVAVPEPSSTALLGLGGIALILRRRK
jgi:hypothetical protein